MPDRAALITALILDQPMCLDCIGGELGLSRSDVDATLIGVRLILVLQAKMEQCRACGAVTTVHSIDRPST